MRGLGILLLFFVGLFILWVATGGPERAREEGTGALFGTVELNVRNNETVLKDEVREERIDREREIRRLKKTLEDLKEELPELRITTPVSPYAGTVVIQSTTAPYADTKFNEYVRIRAGYNNDTSINITGWKLKSLVSGKRAVIGRAVETPRLGVSNQTRPVALAPGERAIVVSGSSPLDYSFKENMCMGYLSANTEREGITTFRTFIPRLKNSCPDPKDELEQDFSVPLSDSDCRFFVERLNQCEVVTDDLDDLFDERGLDLTNACRVFIEETLTYEGCVADHQYDSDFYGRTWRLYLDAPAEIWEKDRDIIQLLDAENRVVDVISY